MQDNDFHFVDELVLPANSTSSVQIVLRPRVDFHESELIFGCNWMENRGGTKPEAIAYFASFIKEGMRREGRPATNPDHYTDYHGFYHIVRGHQYVLGTDRALGFTMVTRNAGLYRADIVSVGEEVEGKVSLRIRVEDNPRTPMQCVTHPKRNCIISPHVEEPELPLT